MARGPKPIATLQRILSRVEYDPTTQCWNWPGSLSREGYGRIASRAVERSPGYTHRYVYALLVAPIPHGLKIDHLCRNRRCCNPDHLEAVPHVVNVRRGASGVLKTHCKWGHPLSGENLTSNNRGDRICRICQRTRQVRGQAAHNQRRRDKRAAKRMALSS